MANELPQYRASTEIRPAPVPNVGQPYQKLSALLDTFSDRRGQQAQQVANYKAAEAGEAAGYNMNYQPTAGNSEVDRVYNQAAKHTNRLVLGAEASANIQRMTSEITNDPNVDPHTMKQKFASSVQGYVEGTLPNIEPSSRPFFENMVKYKANTGLMAIDKHVAAGAKAQIGVEARLTSDQYYKDAATAARSGDMTAAGVLFGQTKQTLDLALKAGAISPAYYAGQLKQLHDGMHEQTYLGQYDRTPNAEKPKFIEDFTKYNHPDLSPEQIQTTVTKMRALSHQAQQSDKANNISIDMVTKDNLARVKNGLEPDAIVEQRLAEVYPEKYKTYLIDKQNALKEHAVSVGLHDIPASQAPGVLAQYAPDPKSPGYQKGLVSLAAAQTEYEQKQLMLKNDPAAYTQDSPLYKSAYEKHQADHDDDSFNSWKLSYQQSMNVSPEKRRLIPAADAASMVAKIKSTDYQAGLNMLQGLSNQYGRYAPIALKSLTDQKLPQSYIIAMGMQNIPKSSAAVPDLIQAQNLAEGKIPGSKSNELNVIFNNSGGKPEDLNNKVSSAMHDFIATTNNASTMSEEAQSEYISTVRNLAKLYVSRGDNLNDAVKKAYNVTIGNRYEAIERYYRVPHGISPSNVSTAMRVKDQELASFDFKEMVVHNPYLSKQYVDQRQYNDAIKAGHWVSMPDDTGWARVDVNGLPVIDKNGHPFMLRNEDVLNPLLQYTPAYSNTLPDKEKLKGAISGK